MFIFLCGSLLFRIHWYENNLYGFKHVYMFYILELKTNLEELDIWH